MRVVQQEWLNLVFDLQKAVVKTYTLMLYLLGEYPAPIGQRNKEHLA
jgi:hypothetical protein